MPVTGTEWELLKALGDLGGRTAVAAAARKAGVSTDYARIVLDSVGRYDYVDTYRSGKVELTRKGWNELKRKGWQPPEDESEEGKKQQPEVELTPMEKIRRLFDTEEISAAEYQARRLEIRKSELGWLQPTADQGDRPSTSPAELIEGR